MKAMKFDLRPFFISLDRAYECMKVRNEMPLQ